MTLFEDRLTTRALTQAVQAKVLAGASRDRLRQVVWADRGAEVLIHGASFKLRMDGGWLVSTVDMEADQVARQPVMATFFLGKGDDGRNLKAATKGLGVRRPPPTPPRAGRPSPARSRRSSRRPRACSPPSTPSTPSRRGRAPGRSTPRPC